MTPCEQPKDVSGALARGLKLYVIGERSGNPADWSMVSDRVFVMAETPGQALQLAPVYVEQVAYEVKATEPCVLCEDRYLGDSF